MRKSSLPPPPPPPSRTSFGGYTLLERIAVGGMAEIFLAIEERLTKNDTANNTPSPMKPGESRQVVMKRMLPTMVHDESPKKLFEQEIILSQKVLHPNIITVLDHGTDEGLPFLILEFLPGMDLWKFTRVFTREGKSLGPELSVFVVRKLLLALHAIHQSKDDDGNPLRIIHRDVSPSNLLLSRYGDIKLSDFGIAQVADHPLTPHEPTRGKLGYLAPEQVRGEPAYEHADVFSAGVILAELLIQKPLFTGGSELAILLAIRDAQIKPFEDRADTLPPGLSEVVKKALQKNPKDRFSSAIEFANALAPFVKHPEPSLVLELAHLVEYAMGKMQEHKRSTSANNIPKIEQPLTQDTPLFEFFVRDLHGVERGPYALAKMIEAITTRELGPEDRVRHGTTYHKIKELSMLARHLPTGSLATGNLDKTTRPQEAMVNATKVWNLLTASVSQPLAYVAGNKASGLLLCEQGNVRKEVYVTDGAPEFVSSNVAGELLGEFLISHAILSRGELDMALAVMPRFEGRLGDTLIALGLVEPMFLFQQIAIQVHEKLMDLFTWTHGSCSFYEGIERPTAAFPLGIDPWKLLEEGIERRLKQGIDQERMKQLKAQVEKNPTHVPYVPAWLLNYWEDAPASFPMFKAIEHLQKKLTRLDSPARAGHLLLLSEAAGVIKIID